MNIFVSDLSPTISAQNLDDKRVIKMTLESAQILSTIGHGDYKLTHQKHPCTLWAAQSPSNTLWLFRHFMALNDEYRYRFGRNHASVYKVHAFHFGEVFSAAEVSFPMTFVICPGGDLEADPTYAYRAILNYKWQHDLRAPKWTKRQPPSWSSPCSTKLPGNVSEG